MASAATPHHYPQAVLFDLLTALLDSWTVWNRAAGSEQAGRLWRAEYLRLTYGCGAYEPYEELVRLAAANTGMPAQAAGALEANWLSLPAWSGAKDLLQTIRPHTKIGVVTNCSRKLGLQAANLLGVDWDVVITSEEAGFYKPHPRPYQLALEKLSVTPEQTAFVAGSGYDLIGTQQAGLRTFWHNRVGLSKPVHAPDPEQQSQNLEPCLTWLQNFSRS
jgi:2-haloacid dehalogenase